MRSVGVSVGLGLLAAAAISADSAAPRLRGYSAKDVDAELKLEQAAQQVPNTRNLHEYLMTMAGEPHIAGSPRSEFVAQYILRHLRAWGLDAHMEDFEALMPYPTIRVLEVLGPQRYIAKLKEPPVAQDPTSGQTTQIPTYNAYSATADVAAEVVYVNYGAPSDYDWLAKQGISVRGKIVLARYGKTWRGIKPKVAAEHGAVGCLIYSDPHEDGYFVSEPFPKGPMRPQDGVQRGSVMDMPMYPGDPLSPGWASERGSKRLSISEAKTIMKIPVLPISYGDAEPILGQLAGPVVPEDWRGALPFTYHAGPGAARVHMKTDYDWTTKPLHDVIATIPGEEAKDEWIIAGNHHDAWVNGADDPISGASALLETARALATLRKQGWKPRRTIKIAFWDGEEFGLLGSTEWVEKHQDELREKGAIYLNSDNTAKGWLNVSGSHTLEQAIADLAGTVPQPGTSDNLAHYAQHHPVVEPNDQPPPPTKSALTIGALGAGSDYQGFLDFIGIASMNSGFGGETRSGIYHSIYDDPYWYTHFSDTDQVDGRALSQFTASAVIRFADAPVLPFEFTRFASTVSGYLDEIRKESETEGHKIDVAPLKRAVEEIKNNGTKYNALLDAAQQRDGLDAAKLRDLNTLLIKTERSLTYKEGLPNRPWYKHQIYAPGFYTGYDVKTVPGVREAVDQKDWTLAQQEGAIVEQCLSDMNKLIEQAVQILSGP